MECGSKATKVQLQAWDGALLGGQDLKIQSTDYKMSGDEIMEFISSKLQEKEETEAVAAQYGFLGQEKPSGRVYQAKEKKPTKTGNGNKSSSPKEKKPQTKQDWTEVKKKGKKGGEDQKGKGKGGRGKPRSPDRSPPVRAPSPQDNYKGKGKGSGGNQDHKPGICFPCERGGRPCEHPFTKCPYWFMTKVVQYNGPMTAELAAKLQPPKKANSEGATSSQNPPRV